MHRNVMSRNIARRLGAYANDPRTYRHVCIPSSPVRWQHTFSAIYEHEREHRQNLTTLQEEDRQRVIPVKAHIERYVKLLDSAQETVEGLSALPLEGAESTLALQESRASKIITHIERLKDRLESLRQHLKDLETEPYPTAGISDKDLDWEVHIKSMSPQMRKDTLSELELETSAERNRVMDGLRSIAEYQASSSAQEEEKSPAPVARKEAPPPSAAKPRSSYVEMEGPAKVRKQTIGPIPAEPFKKVVSVAGGEAALMQSKTKEKEKPGKVSYSPGQHSGSATTWQPTSPAGGKPDADTASAETKPKQNGSDLLSLQAKLEASFKRSRSPST